MSIYESATEKVAFGCKKCSPHTNAEAKGGLRALSAHVERSELDWRGHGDFHRAIPYSLGVREGGGFGFLELPAIMGWRYSEQRRMTWKFCF